MNKRIKFLKYIFKNKTSFIDFKIQFYFNLGYNHHVSSSEIENIKKYEFTFNDKTLNQKQEIKLNNFLIKLLNCFKIDLIKEGLKIDIETMEVDEVKYDEKENTLEKIRNTDDSLVILNKISKKNCNSNKNKFSIKILNTKYGFLIIGISNLKFDYKEQSWKGKNLETWGFKCYNESNTQQLEKDKYLSNDLLKDFKGKNGDIISLKYNSIKGEIEIFINNESKGLITNKVDIKQDYRFVITMYSIGDKIHAFDLMKQRGSNL